MNPYHDAHRYTHLKDANAIFIGTTGKVNKQDIYFVPTAPPRFTRDSSTSRSVYYWVYKSQLNAHGTQISGIFADRIDCDLSRNLRGASAATVLFIKAHHNLIS